MNDLISRQAAIEALKREEAIWEFPSAQPERKKGKWIKEDGMANGIVMRVVKCSLCKEKAGINEEGFWHLSNYCPNCGADMRGEQE